MKQVIVVRKDLKLGRGKLASQVAHASVSAIIHDHPLLVDNLSMWIDQGMPKIVISCNSEDELFQLQQNANSLGLINALIQDAGKTEVAPGTYTCLAIGPGDDNQIDDLTGDLKLL